MPRLCGVYLGICVTTEEKARKNLSQGKVKGKAIPLQAWTDPEGSRRMRLPDFKTIVI